MLEIFGWNYDWARDAAGQESRRTKLSAFTPVQIEYLQGQRLGRLTTVNESGEPHVIPTSLRYTPELDALAVVGHNLGKSKKFRDVGRTGRAAFVVDDVLPPWQASGVEVRGRAEVFSEGGGKVNSDFDAELISLHPSRIVGWGFDTTLLPPEQRVSRLANVWGGAKQ